MAARINIDFGFTPSGYIQPSYEQLREYVVGLFVAELGNNIDTSDDALIGKHISITATLLMAQFSLYQQQQTFFDKSQAEGAVLTQIGELLQLPRYDAEYSTAVLEMRGVNVTVPAGKVVTNESNTVRFVTLESAVLSGVSSPVEVLARAEEKGDIGDVDAESLTRIESPVAGWIVSAANPVPVTNMSPASPGRDVESDADYRARIKAAGVGGTGRATLPAIERAMRAVVGVDDVNVESNRNRSYDYTRQIPGKTVHVILSPDTVRDDLVGEALYDVIGATDDTMGDNEYIIERDDGEDHVVRWNWAVDVEVYLNVWLTVDDDFPDDGVILIQSAVEEYVGQLGIADEIKFSPLNALVFNTAPGVLTVEFDIRENSRPATTPGTPPNEWPYEWTGPTYAPNQGNQRLVVSDSGSSSAIRVGTSGRPSS